MFGKTGVSTVFMGGRKYFDDFPMAASDRCIKTVNIRRRSVGEEKQDMRIQEKENESGRSPAGKTKRKSWLSNSVSKKGDRVPAFSIGMPNGKCPFASDICRRYCYADTGQFTFHFERYAENYEFTFQPEFAETITTEIVKFVEHHPEEQISVALHEKGEIYSIPYLKKWEQVISSTHDLTNLNFFIYTRAWRSEPFRKALEELAARHNNVQINLSADSDMVVKFGVPARIGKGLVTYLAETDDDIPPAGVDLVFRNLRMRHNDSMERLGGVLVCPYESKLYIARNKDGAPALERGKCRPIRCQECRLCIDRSPDDWETVKGRYAGTPGLEPFSETASISAIEDPPQILSSDREDIVPPTSEEERLLQDKIERAVTRFQSSVIETCLNAADNGGAIAPYTRDRLTNTAVMIYQFANNILPPREEP